MNGLDPVEPEINDLADARSPLSRTLIQVGVTLATAAVVLVLAVVTGLLSRTTTTESVEFQVDPTDRIRLILDGLDVRLEPTSGDAITVAATVESGWRETDYEVEQRGGDISLSSSCVALLVPGCGASVVIGIPAGTQFELDTGEHDVQLEGIDAVATVSSSSGNITARDLQVVEIDVTTTSGNIDLRHAVQPYSVKATSDSGDVSIELPEGQMLYDSVIASDSGDVENQLTNDGQDAEGFISAETGSGDIEVTQR